MKKLYKKGGWTLSVALLLVGIAASAVFSADGIITKQGDVTSYTIGQGKGAATIDFENAIPMPLPQSPVKPSGPAVAGTPRKLKGSPGFSPGSRGQNGVAPTAGEMGNMPDPAQVEARMEYGTSNHPFTTSRVDVGTNNAVSKLYPFRAAGKLYFNDGSSTYVCSASMIKPGIIVTAAHCVAAFGEQRFFTNWQYVPALYGKTKPYQTWSTVTAYIKQSYYDGTDTCAVPGVVCENDVAVLVAKPKGKAYPGKSTGWFGYGWDGYGFTPSGTTLINQLGYPVSHDSGLIMQRTDSQGYVDSAEADNTVWGSRQTGGSSGGPELVNLGVVASLNGTAVGTDWDPNTVVGVTSWGYTDTTVKQQGASPFTSNNIVSLVNTACAAYPSACQ